MKEITASKLPGFCTDERGAYGIVLGAVYICCHKNSDDGQYDVTVDTVDCNGDFALNLERESFPTPEQAVVQLHTFVKKYVPKNVR